MSDHPERKFLHDIASPLAASLFIVDMLKDAAEERSGADSRELKQVTQVHELLVRIKKMIEERRATLIQAQATDSERKSA